MRAREAELIQLAHLDFVALTARIINSRAPTGPRVAPEPSKFNCTSSGLLVCAPDFASPARNPFRSNGGDKLMFAIVVVLVVGRLASRALSGAEFAPPTRQVALASSAREQTRELN